MSRHRIWTHDVEDTKREVLARLGSESRSLADLARELRDLGIDAGSVRAALLRLIDGGELEVDHDAVVTRAQQRIG